MTTILSLPPLTLEELKDISRLHLLAISLSAASNKAIKKAQITKCVYQPGIAMMSKNNILEEVKKYAIENHKVYSADIVGKYVDELIDTAQMINLDSIEAIINLYN